MKPTALLLNICSASVAAFRYQRELFSWRLFWPFAVSSVPFAYIGGTRIMPSPAYKLALGAFLLISAVWPIAARHEVATRRTLRTPLAIIMGAAIGFASRPDRDRSRRVPVAHHPDPLFEKPDAAAPGIRRRHHTRVWQTSWCAPSGCPLWVATASFDIGVELSAKLHLPTHRIDPNIDQERVLIVADLTRAGAREIGTLTVVPPLRGTNAAGDVFTTDGRAAVVAIP